MKEGEFFRRISLNFLRLAGLVVALGCLAVISLGAWAWLEGLWNLVRYGEYAEEPFWRFAGLKPSRNILLNLDKAWWLILGGTTAFIANTALVGLLIRALRRNEPAG